MAKTTPTRRQQGAIRRRGRSFQVSVYAGLDPVTGKRLYLTDSTTDEAEARRILRRLTAEVNGQRHSKTRATLQTTIEAWLDTHELAERTLETYREYAANHIYPVLGPEPQPGPPLTSWNASTPSFAVALTDVTAGPRSIIGSTGRTSAGRSGTSGRRADRRRPATHRTTVRRRAVGLLSASRTLVERSLPRPSERFTSSSAVRSLRPCVGAGSRPTRLRSPGYLVCRLQTPIHHHLPRLRRWRTQLGPRDRTGAPWCGSSW